MIKVEIVPMTGLARCREKGPTCRGLARPYNKMPGAANQKKGEKMLRIEASIANTVVVHVWSTCMPAVLAKFAAVEVPS